MPILEIMKVAGWSRFDNKPFQKGDKFAKAALFKNWNGCFWAQWNSKIIKRLTRKLEFDCNSMGPEISP